MRRWFATIAGISIFLFGGLSLAMAQEGFPLRDDDLAYAKKLSAAGLDDLAIDIYERLAAMTSTGRVIKSGDGYHLAG